MTSSNSGWWALGVGSVLAVGCPPAGDGADDRTALDRCVDDGTVLDRRADDGALSDSGARDSRPLDGATDDQWLPDRSARDVRLPDRAASDYGPWDAAACQGEDAAWSADHGFCIRVPQVRDVPGETWSGEPNSYPELDLDHVCTLNYGTLRAFVYVQARDTYCVEMQGCSSTVDGAWISVDGVVSPIGATYNAGGNHHNDSLRIDYGGREFNYYHSSFGYGWRACQPFDCTEVYELGGTTLIENGCTVARTVPQACVRVGADGTVPPLVDNFAHCPGDPNYMDAGAGG